MAIANKQKQKIGRGDLTDPQWEKLHPLLPPQKPKTGRPNLEHRQVINGILWILRTGAPWRDLPPCYGVHSTVSSRFYRWRKAGIWDEILAKLGSVAKNISLARNLLRYGGATALFNLIDELKISFQVATFPKRNYLA